MAQRNIIDCIDKNIDDDEKDFLRSHTNNIKALKDGYTWSCLHNNFGLDDEKIECVLSTYISNLNGFAVFDGNCFEFTMFGKATLDFKDW